MKCRKDAWDLREQHCLDWLEGAVATGTVVHTTDSLTNTQLTDGNRAVLAMPFCPVLSCPVLYCAVGPVSWPGLCLAWPGAGMQADDGRLIIIDRRKSFVKLSNGEVTQLSFFLLFFSPLFPSLLFPFSSPLFFVNSI